jgi:hypothetical protein
MATPSGTSHWLLAVAHGHALPCGKPSRAASVQHDGTWGGSWHPTLSSIGGEKMVKTTAGFGEARLPVTIKPIADDGNIHLVTLVKQSSLQFANSLGLLRGGP